MTLPYFLTISSSLWYNKFMNTPAVESLSPEQTFDLQMLLAAAQMVVGETMTGEGRIAPEVGRRDERAYHDVLGAIAVYEDIPFTPDKKWFESTAVDLVEQALLGKSTSRRKRAAMRLALNASLFSQTQEFRDLCVSNGIPLDSSEV
jgi:hypothetical protein